MGKAGSREGAMKFTRVWTRVAMVGLLGVGLAGNIGRSQKGQNPPQPAQNPGQAAPDPFGQQGDPKSKIELPPFANNEDKQAKMRDAERQKRLVADTDRLLELVTQLHADVAKTDRHILSVDVGKRADEIEKLAHSVKEREKG
jgi:hypothetical protein